MNLVCKSGRCQLTKYANEPIMWSIGLWWDCCDTSARIGQLIGILLAPSSGRIDQLRFAFDFNETTPVAPPSTLLLPLSPQISAGIIFLWKLRKVEGHLSHVALKKHSNSEEHSRVVEYFSSLTTIFMTRFCLTATLQCSVHAESFAQQSSFYQMIEIWCEF